ncbi:LysR family transcriptional regulator [uncultured Tateyamaria sp.]|uniref:LysR family transcriptional regulator n=1 Tax=uncultured Tateyamaria sp. TaxID=455651 RepID=UPI0026102430|nr:LysR family transcriptional regulator [uncultured Tateyamaria sp.]
MELRQLRYFRVIAEVKSFSRASSVLRVSQPALSRQIKLIEAELGTDLFFRDGRGVQLTPAGQEFYEHVTRIEARLIKARESAARHANRPGKITIGLLPSFGPLFMTKVTTDITARFPQADFVLIEDYSYQLIDWVNSKRLDLAIVYGDQVSGPCRTIPFSTERLFLMTAADTSVIKDEIRFADLAGFELLTQAVPSTSRTTLESIAETLNVKLTFGSQIDSLPTLRHLVANHGAHCVMPYTSAAQDVAKGDLRAVRITDPSPELNLSVIVPNEPISGHPWGEVITILENCLADMITSGMWRGVVSRLRLDTST